MKRYKRVALFIALVLLLFLLKTLAEGKNYSIQKAGDSRAYDSNWNAFVAENLNKNAMKITTNGVELPGVKDAYMSDELEAMIPVRYANEVFDCAAVFYADKTLYLERNTDHMEMSLATERKAGLVEKDGKFYVPAKTACEALNLSYQFDMDKNSMVVSPKNVGAKSVPYKYDLREQLRNPRVRNQGDLGACWAFAAVSSLESSQLPYDPTVYSVDHMLRNNSFSYDISSGGGYTMGMAYLVNWQGPVKDEDDSFGDGKTDSSLEAVKHVQEMRLIAGNDAEAIKKAVYKYGGVQASIYNSLSNAFSSSEHYNKYNNAYCYIGPNKANHELVIVGWDDGYSKDNFALKPEGDGAFICQNSWGTAFGDNGYFYVSYYDSNIKLHTLAITSVEDTDNYDNIYQSDLCGWAGQVGFNEPTAYAMNVYEAVGNEMLQAAGFYATGPDTEYKIYLAKNVSDPKKIKSSELDVLASGKLNEAGYYTIPFDAQSVKAGERFAIIIKLTVPNAVHPVAIEYAASEFTKNADLSDGEGYIGRHGDDWASTEKVNNCNVCLKVYSKKE